MDSLQECLSNSLWFVFCLGSFQFDYLLAYAVTIFSSVDMKAYFVQLCAVRDKVSELLLSYLYLGNEMDALLFAETTWFTRVSRYGCLGRCEACPNLKHMTEPGNGPVFV